MLASRQEQEPHQDGGLGDCDAADDEERAQGPARRLFTKSGDARPAPEAQHDHPFAPEHLIGAMSRVQVDAERAREIAYRRQLAAVNRIPLETSVPTIPAHEVVAIDL